MKLMTDDLDTGLLSLKEVVDNIQKDYQGGYIWKLS